MTPLLGHGLAVRGEVPLPLWAVAVGAAAALILSFVALARLWKEPRFEGAAGSRGIALGSGTSRLADVGEWPVRVFGVAVFLVVWAAALIGPFNADQNLAPYAIYVGLWTAGMIASGLVGDVWHVLSPFETVGRVASSDPEGAVDVVDWLGLWPAAGMLLLFMWLELVHPNPADPRTLGIAIGVYVGVMLLGTMWWGRPWIRSAEAFGALFRLLAAMSPLGRDEDGRMRLRPPLAGLGSVHPVQGTAALVIVALGATTFDGVTRTGLWETIVGDRSGWALVPYGTVGMLITIGLVAAVWVHAMRRAARITGHEVGDLAERFAHSLLPIALGYAVAHYFGLLLFQGQRLLALASDPFGYGWNVFGTADWVVNYDLVSPLAIGIVQAAAIVVGHLAGVVLAHDRAVAMFPPGEAARSQRALLDVMVVYTVTGLVLLLGG